MKSKMAESELGSRIKGKMYIKIKKAGVGLIGTSMPQSMFYAGLLGERNIKDKT